MNGVGQVCKIDMGQMIEQLQENSSEEKKDQDQTNEKEDKLPPFGLITQSFTSQPVSSSSPLAQGGDGRNANRGGANS